ncbi:Mur ligase family protein [Solirubrobacter taibaiensis]|nr:Mur ligase family protein [Solirubrobacter taibaiensis]
MAGSNAAAARCHREAVSDVTFVAVTGSCGKSTTVHLADRLLRGQLRGIASAPNANCGDPLIDNLLRVGTDDDYCLQELGAWGPGTLDIGLELTRPTVGVVLNVRQDHLSAFGALAGTQAEKAKVVAALPPDGTAILGIDDDRVREMRALTRARVLTFGRAPDADLRARDVAAAWPDRLSFRLTYAGEDHYVQTALLGEQSLGSALAAIAITITLGMRPEAAIAGLREIEPLPRRMSAVTLADQVTFVRDDFKAPSDSMPEVLRFMAQARALRKLAIFGRISDHRGRSRRPYTEIAEAALTVVDDVIFVGQRAQSLWRDEDVPWTTHGSVEAAAHALDGHLHAGDLVLLKACGPADHLERILLARSGEVRCWLSDCGRVLACDDCELLHAGADR